ncbi:MAG TPA: GntR family transcriptional regulator [Ruminiclostridium sp.]
MLFPEGEELDKRIPIPLYYQLKNILLRYIKQHSDKFDEPIPTEVEISIYFDISRPTVRQAIKELVVEGYLYRVKSKGTFITKPKIDQDFMQNLDSFNNEMHKKNYIPSTKILNIDVIDSNEEISKALQIPQNSKVIVLERLRFANEEPIVFVVTYLPYYIFSNILNQKLEEISLYEIMEKEYGFVICKAVRHVESFIANEAEAKILKIEKGAAIQYFESIVYSAEDTPVEFSKAKYRGDRNKFKFVLKRN